MFMYFHLISNFDIIHYSTIGPADSDTSNAKFTTSLVVEIYYMPVTTGSLTIVLLYYYSNIYTYMLCIYFNFITVHEIIRESSHDRKDASQTNAKLKGFILVEILHSEVIKELVLLL